MYFLFPVITHKMLPQNLVYVKNILIFQSLDYKSLTKFNDCTKSFKKCIEFLVYKLFNALLWLEKVQTNLFYSIKNVSYFGTHIANTVA